MGSTQYVQLPFPELGDTPDVPRDLRNLANRLDAVLAPLVNKEVCLLVGQGTQSIPSVTFTKLTFWQPLAQPGYNAGDLYDAAQKGIRIKTAGLYWVGGQVNFAPNTTGHRVFRVRRNGGDLPAFGEFATSAYNTGANSSWNAIVSGSLVLPCQANDLLTLEAWQGSGAALNVNGYASGWHMSAFQVVRLD